MGNEPIVVFNQGLVGLAPQLVIDNETVVIRATSRQHAACKSFRSGLASSVSKLFAAHDVLHIHRSCCAGLGFSLIRNNQLLFAIGDICSVPLGNVAEYHSHEVRD
ncbi:MAG TPA: hypothetical protein DDZ51_14685 [Planctomycetaceae bacterium]|nr:hypothetical protein [Planctomycetaceae bacterium]